MRLDKFLSTMGCCSRADAKRIVRRGGVSVNGIAAKSADMPIVPERDRIVFEGRYVPYQKYVYIMMNKPEGVVSATEDGRDRTVLDLLPPDACRAGLFPCGRLDKNTLGLVLLTDNGELGHRLLAPKSHATKIYRFESKFRLTDEEAVRFENGLVLEDGYVTLPAKITLDATGNGGYITLTEGKYHQIKRMLESLNNRITYLERVRFGPLTLDPALARGEWRYLSDKEIAALEAHGKDTKNI
jgi:16S rRNA pseudouridine516 synthase